MKIAYQILVASGCLDCKRVTGGDPDDPHEHMREICVGCFREAFDAAVAEAVAEEREACAKAAAEFSFTASVAIRARSEAK